MATWTSNRRLNGLLIAAVLAFTGVSGSFANDYQPFPNTTPGATYYWRNYSVDEHGKRTFHGVYTNTIEGKTIIGEHEYVVVKRVNPEKKPLSDIIYRCDDQLFGMLLGPSESDLLIHWKGAPTAGQAWTRGSQKIVIRGQENVEVEGVMYRDCWVLDQLDDGQLVNRSYFSREDGWVETVRYRDGKVAVIGFRVPAGS